MGCGAVALTDVGVSDRLFSFFPKTFKANMGHQDRVSVLPDNAFELASNDVAPFQAIRIEDKAIYGTQFHSELDAEAEYSRIVEYREHYPLLADDETFHRIVESLEPTTEVDTLLNRFLLTFAVDGKAA
jgi:GMP synthase (glutamine-hydrolysing)